MFVRLAAMASALALGASPQVQAWTVDPARTGIAFSVDDVGFSHVHGIFHEFTADVSFDPDHLEATRVRFTVEADSVETFWEERNAQVRGPELLDAANHPEITFVSTAVEQTADDAAQVTGDLTIKGVTRPVTFAATLNRFGPNPLSPEQQIAGFTLTGEIDRTAFGIDCGAPTLGPVLPVTVNVELTALTGES